MHVPSPLAGSVSHEARLAEEEGVQEGNSPSAEACVRIQQPSSQCARQRRLLYLFSGPGRDDSVKHYGSLLGWEVDEIDIEARPSSDLLDLDV